ncbi:MAG TPA: dTMP kinase [Bacteroidota bacterium]|nr:dTMP kinase [Bacteroidota bacterium]
MFITFEGVDASGKSTQAKLLVDRLRREEEKVLLLREPGGTDVSEKIRSILLDRSHLNLTQLSELLLFSAARAQLVREVIRPALMNGVTVVCDRFYDSTTAYQGYGRGLGLDQIRLINALASDGRAPDLTFIVQISVAEIVRRKSLSGETADRMESSGPEFYQRVLDGYRAIAAEEPDRCVLLDGMLPVDELRQAVWHLTCQRHQNLSMRNA